MKIDKLQLLEGININIDNTCTIHQPKLLEVADITLDTYRSYLSILLTEKDYFAKLLDGLAGETIIQELLAEDIHIFDLIMLFEDTRSVLLDALSFFICEKLQIVQNICIGIYDENGICQSVIDSGNYDTIRDVILEISCIKISRVENLKFKSEASRKRYMKLLEYREKANKNKNATNDENQNLENLIGAVSARGYGYNLLNIWQLTVYQLYDQFRRIHNNTVMDIAGTPILMFGGDKNKFDETFWFKNYENK